MVYRAVFLDMDHTLCDTERADRLGLQDFQNSLGAEFKPETAKMVGERYLQIIYGEKKDTPGWQKDSTESETQYRARLLGMILEEEFSVSMAEEKRVSYAKLLMTQRMTHFDFFPGVAAMLKRLRKKYSLIVISNGPLFSQEPKVARVAMERHVDEILLGGMFEHEKPHPSIFTLACKKAGCTPNEAIHVGDKLDSDILGAANSHIASVWIEPDGKNKKPVPVPDYTIANVIELEQLLEQIDK